MSKITKKKKDHPIDIATSLMALISLMLYLNTKNIVLAIITFLLGTAISIFVVVKISLKKKKKDYQKLLNSGIDDLDTMSGLDFEKFILVHFQNQGYKGEVTKATNDYGADLILNKDGSKIVVQAKRWKDKVGITAIQEIVGAINYYGASKGMVITNSYFTSNAQNLAKANNIELWDRDMLIGIMSKNQGKNLAEKLKYETEVQAEYCPMCKSKLLIRKGKRGSFWGCSNFPKCRFTKDLN
ncbi:restriction endonuclease [Tissierella creatinophila]|uniref:Mrr restriction system protein n=1 Tax=Tissierella creatinophila DSM 6911 TaxID=1123403 RepID=A0A1U7M930_TISCR|nr:restriction endonuclease [Tissierella creatinophila]OLS03786.1 Mrr restriction system protein [Tissierella creatinophila DSM 6911]